MISCLLVITALIWAGIYARKQGFTNSWRQAVENELKEQGYHIDIGKLTLGAFRGLVAEDVKLYRDEGHTELLAEMNDIFLDVGLKRVLQKRITLNTLDFQDGTLTFPLNPGHSADGKKLEVTNFSGRIALTESFVEVVRIEAELSGVEIFMKGRLLRGRRIETEGLNAFQATELKIQALKRIIDTLESFEFTEGPPTVTIDFRGDLRDLSKTTARAVLKSGSFRKRGGGYNVLSFNAEANLDGQIRQIKIPRLELNDQRGVLVADASWNQKSDEIDFTVKSNADIKNLLEFFFPNKKWGEVVIYQPPKVTAEGTINLRASNKNGAAIFFPGQIIGEFKTDSFVSAGKIFKSSKGDFSVKGESFYVRNVRVEHKTGVAFLNCKYEPGKGQESLQFQSAVKLDPGVFEPFLKDEGTRRFLRKWDFRDDSGVHLEASGQSSSLRLDDLQAKGEIDLRNFELNEIEFRELEAKFEVNGPERWYRDLQFIRDDGEISANLAYTNTDKRVWEIKGGRSTVGILEAVGAFNPDLKDKLRPFRFNHPPSVTFQGVVDSRSAEQRAGTASLTDLELTFSGKGALQCELFGKEISLDSPDGSLALRQGRVNLKSFKAGFCGGTFEVESELPDFLTSNSSLKSKITANGIGLRSLGKYYDFENDAKGYLDGTIEFSKKTSRPGRINGFGQVSVSDKDLFQIPFLKDLEDLLVDNEKSHSRQFISEKRSAVGFGIKEGVLSTNEVSLMSGTVNLKGNAEINFPGKSIEAELTPTTGSSRRVYRCSGNLATPEWKAAAGPKSTVLSGR